MISKKVRKRHQAEWGSSEIEITVSASVREQLLESTCFSLLSRSMCARACVRRMATPACAVQLLVVLVCQLGGVAWRPASAPRFRETPVLVILFGS